MEVAPGSCYLRETVQNFAHWGAKSFGALIAASAIAIAGCGSTAAPEPLTKRDAGAPPTLDAAVRELPAMALGLESLAAYGWRKRAGHAAFRTARRAEAANDWKAVVASCEKALAADPSNLEASWLLAAAHGELGNADRWLAPLRHAVAGDFGKWGMASLELPALAKFMATPDGEAWRRRVEQDRATYIATLDHSLLVFADGDIFAFDPAPTGRWYRMTRTFGAVIASLRLAPTKLAYVTRQRAAAAGGVAGPITFAIGLVDLARGKTSRAVELGTRAPIMLVAAPDGDGVWIAGGKPLRWRRLDNNFKLTDLPATTARPAGPSLEVYGKSARLRALPLIGVTADWDDKGLASALRITKSGRIIAIPAPGLIDGNTGIWSPDRSKLAFVALLNEQCTDRAAAAVFVADATTGQLRELERGSRLAVEWVTDQTLVIAKAKQIEVKALSGDRVTALPGADGLIAPRSRARCTPEPDDVTDEPPPVEGDQPQ